MVYLGGVSFLPLIGISGRNRTGAEINISPSALRDRRVDLYFCDYALGVIAAGGLPVYLPSDADAGHYAARLDGLLLSGGTDIEPSRYGAQPVAEVFTPEPDRDAFEMSLLDNAADAGLPVLGICRGIQVLNVHSGGTLNQHVPEHACFNQPPAETVHEVRFTDGSLMASLYGASRKVNSLHHQTLASVGAGYTVTGLSEDGTVEAIESSERRWLGVQWHPEMMEERDLDPVFAWLVNTASAGH